MNHEEHTKGYAIHTQDKAFRGSLSVKMWCRTHLESLDVRSDLQTPRLRFQSGQETMTHVLKSQ